MNPLTLIELIGQDEFLAGLGWGLVGGLLIFFSPSRWRPVPIWGLIVAACVVGGAWPFVDTGPLVALGIAVLSIGGELVGRGRWWGVFLIGGGAAAVALADGIPDIWWVRVGTVLFIGIGGWAIGRLSAVLADTGVPALMVAGTAFGVWATVPDTEIAATFLGALTPLVFTAWPQVRAIVGSGGAYAIAGALAWAIAEGGAARAGSIIGGWGTIGAFVGALFVSRLLAERRWYLFAVHGVAVLLTSRVAGMFETGSAALVVVVPVLVAAAAATRFLAVASPHSTNARLR